MARKQREKSKICGKRSVRPSTEDSNIKDVPNSAVRYPRRKLGSDRKLNSSFRSFHFQNPSTESSSLSWNFTFGSSSPPSHSYKDRILSTEGHYINCYSRSSKSLSRSIQYPFSSFSSPSSSLVSNYMARHPFGQMLSFCDQDDNHLSSAKSFELKSSSSVVPPFHGQVQRDDGGSEAFKHDGVPFIDFLGVGISS